MVNLSIIILSYNTKDLILDCLKSIISIYKEKLGKGELEIIVADNNSSDGSAQAIENLHIKNLNLIKNKENFGFAKGCNLGEVKAKGKYILFLNSDTKVLDKGFDKMIEFLESNPKIGILGGKLKNSDGTAQPSAGKFYNLINLLIMLLGFERLGFLRSSPGKIKKVDWVSGACMMVRKDVFQKLRGFDENLFMYVEDMEICFRAKKIGFSTYFFPDLSLIHNCLGSSNRSFAIINIYKGILNFYAKHKSKLEYFIAKSFLIIKANVSVFVGFLTFNSELKDRYIKALSNL